MKCLPLFRCVIVSVLLTLAFVFNAEAQSIAFTFDDGPQLNQTPLLSPAARNAALLKALKMHKVTAALFVTVDNGANRPEGLAMARAWGVAGHMVGNHTVTHPKRMGSCLDSCVPVNSKDLTPSL